MTDLEQIAKGLTEQERDIARALCGSAWQGVGSPTPGILAMNARELIHIDALRRADGSPIRFKASPTPLGTALRNHLLQKEQGR